MKKLVQRLSKAFPNTFICIGIEYKQYAIEKEEEVEVQYRIYVQNTINIMYIKSMDELKTRVNQIIKEQNEKK